MAALGDSDGAWLIPASPPVASPAQVWAFDGGEWTDVHGDIDFSTGVDFDLIIAEAARAAEGRGLAEVHVDLGHVDFIGVAGARTLVLAAAELGPGRQFVLHNPPAMLVRILDLAWPGVPGLRWSA